jgi:hypothetical protein
MKIIRNVEFDFESKKVKVDFMSLSFGECPDCVQVTDQDGKKMSAAEFETMMDGLNTQILAKLREAGIKLGFENK